MKISQLSQELKLVFKTTFVVQSIYGFCVSIALFSWGPLVYEKLSESSSDQLAITLTVVLLAINKGLVFLLEIPTGALGDAIGRKKTTLWSFRFRTWHFCALAIIPFCESFSLALTTALIAQIFFSLSTTFYSGTFIAWAIDSIKSHDKEMGYEHIVSRISLYVNVSGLFGGVTGVVLYYFGYAYIAYLLAATLCFICVTYCDRNMTDSNDLSFIDTNITSFSKIMERMGEIISTGIKTAIQSKIIFTLIIINSFYLFTIQLTDRLWPVYLRENVDVSNQIVFWGGLVIIVQTISSFGSFTMKKISDYHQKKFQKRMSNKSLINFYIFPSLLIAMPILTLSFLTLKNLDHFYYLAFTIIIISYLSSMITPTFRILINNYIPAHNSQERATIMSFASLIQSLIFLVLSVPSGGTSGAKTTIGWALPAGLLLIATIIGYFTLKKEQNKLQTSI